MNNNQQNNFRDLLARLTDATPMTEREQFAAFEAKLAADRDAVRNELRAREAKGAEMRRTAHVLSSLARN